MRHMNNQWSKIVRDLERRGWSLTSIADKVGLSMQSVSSIKHKRVIAPTGMAAVLLHKLHSSDDAPIGPRVRQSKADAARSRARVKACK